jgi:hypothetical protein
LKRYFRFFFFFFFFFLNFFFKITAQKSTRKSKLAEHHLHASNIVATPSTTTTTTTTTTTAAAHDDTDTALAIAATSRRKRSLALVRANDPPHETIERRSCNCKNSRCLKLYCECFPAVDHQILTNRGFLLLDQVLSLVHSYCADDGTVVVADWRGLAVASFDPNSCSLVYRTPRRLVVNRASPHGVPVVEFNVPHSGVSIVATQHHALYVAPASSSAPFAKVPCVDVLTRRDTVRLLAVASGGVVIDGGVDVWRQMPCIAQLSLTSRAQLVAFLELYGIWLAVGDIDAQAVRFRCAASLLRARYKLAGLRNDDMDVRAGAVYKRSWIDLFSVLRNRSGELLDGALTSLDCAAARAILIGVQAGGSILSSAASNDALRDQLLRLVMHCGFTASFVPVARGWRLELDAAHAEPCLDVCANGAARAYRYTDRTWCFDMDAGFVVVRRVAPTHKDGAVSASRPTIQGNCFAARVYCTDNCACVSCQNTHEHERIVAKAIDDTQERNPAAFSVEEKVAKGCNCKKSSCLKKYCECFQAGIACSRNCRCVDCKNHEGDAARQASSRRLSNVNANVELTTDAPLTVAATDDDAVYLSASQVAAHTVARDWASEVALVDIATSLIKRARHAANDENADDDVAATTVVVAQSPLDSVATAIRESGELAVRGSAAASTTGTTAEPTSESYARQERAVLIGVREILDKAVGDLSRL